MLFVHDLAERQRIAGRARAGIYDTLRRLYAGGLTSGQHLLEVGCGSGMHVAAIAHADKHTKIVGLEPDYNFFIEAKARVRSLPNAQVRMGYAERLPFADNSFDAYYARLVYQHCQQPLLALAEAHRVLRTGGRCMIDDIDRGWFMSWPEPDSVRHLWARIDLAQRAAGGDPWVGRKLGGWLRDCGFRAIVTDVQGLTTDGAGVVDFVGDTGESLLDMLPADERAHGRAVLADWAAQAAADPEGHRLYLGWFMVTATA